MINTTCRSFHICVFIGTQHRSLPDCPVQKRHVNGVLLVEAGAGKGPCTNKSTGVAFTLACGLRESHIARRWEPGPELAGRAY
eukprot:419764-Pyramimonas_sp.AAC.1